MHKVELPDTISSPTANTVLMDNRSINDSLTKEVQIANDKPERKKRHLDYFSSDLIQKNSVYAKHCWFNKKYSY